MRRRWPLILVAICAALTLTAAVLPSSLGKGGTIREWGGHRASEYRPLGIPLSKTALVPGLRVMPDMLQALGKAGFRNLPEVESQSEGEHAWRRTWKDTVCYGLLFPIKRTPADAVDFYTKQLSKVRIRRRLVGEESVEGIAPDGTTWVALGVDLHAATPVALLQFTPNRP